MVLDAGAERTAKWIMAAIEKETRQQKDTCQSQTIIVSRRWNNFSRLLQVAGHVGECPLPERGARAVSAMPRMSLAPVRTLSLLALPQLAD